MCPIFSILAMLPFFAAFIAVMNASITKEKKNKAAEIADLKSKYNLALQAKDKCSALNAGRLYYASLRNDGQLTPFDERTIAHDLEFV